jgi:hypothetical protein
MNIIALSASAWRYHQKQCYSLIEKFTHTYDDEFIVISKVTVEREVYEKDSIPCTFVNLIDFVDMGTSPDGVLDIQKIREFPFLIPSNQTIIINAVGSRESLIEFFLLQCRHGWYELDEWHIGFVLIVDESIILDISIPLSTTFYIQPDILSEPELRAKTRLMIRSAKILRYFGYKVSRLHRWILALDDRLEQRKAKKDIDI